MLSIVIANNMNPRELGHVDEVDFQVDTGRGCGFSHLVLVAFEKLLQIFHPTCAGSYVKRDRIGFIAA